MSIVSGRMSKVEDARLELEMPSSAEGGDAIVAVWAALSQMAFSNAAFQPSTDRSSFSSFFPIINCDPHPSTISYSCTLNQEERVSSREYLVLSLGIS